MEQTERRNRIDDNVIEAAKVLVQLTSAHQQKITAELTKEEQEQADEKTSVLQKMILLCMIVVTQRYGYLNEQEVVYAMNLAWEDFKLNMQTVVVPTSNAIN